MTEALAFLLATFAACNDPAVVPPRPAVSAPIASARARAAWDPETHSWGAGPATGHGAALDSAVPLGGPELPFEPPVEFALPGGGRGVVVERSGMESVRVVRGKDGRFRAICEPAAEPSIQPPASAPTDR
jgi:hypothetical protein